ncbi:unnamed protein product, partial [Mesorhabditis spiculigera]
MGILSKGSTGAEFRYKENKNCTGTMLELEINMKRWAMHEKFHYAFRVWYRNVATVIAPFLILLILNFFIVVALREQPQMSVCTQLAGPAAGDVAKRKSMAHLSDVEYAKRKSLGSADRHNFAAVGDRLRVPVADSHLVSATTAQ